jgi:hypothetical protein
VLLLLLLLLLTDLGGRLVVQLGHCHWVLLLLLVMVMGMCALSMPWVMQVCSTAPTLKCSSTAQHRGVMAGGTWTHCTLMT